MANNPIKVLIADDSVFYRTALQNGLITDTQIQVIGTAGNAHDAETKIVQLSPNVLVLDVEMPGMSGIEFLKKLLPRYPIPVVLISSLEIRLFEALDAGAVDFVKKPNMNSKADFLSFCAELSVKIKVAASAKVSKAVSPASPAAAVNPLIPAINMLMRYHILAIGASTGGTETTLKIIQQLPSNIPGMLITQHMPAGFTQMYAERLNRLCKFSVAEAKNGDRLERGQALVAPGNQHMRLYKDALGYYVHCSTGEKVSGHCPSVDVLFDSVAKVAGKDAIGIILTGMGRDGASGLLNLRKAGGFTIGQDKASCVVYGMPMVAYDIGAVMRQLPYDAIAGQIVQLLNS